MSLRFHEIAEANHQLLNPFTEQQFMLLGEICRLDQAMNMLDLACGKGEMLCRWSQKFGISGVGVDISKTFLAAAEKRAAELNVADKITFIYGDAGEYPQPSHSFDLVSCIGATWIGNGLVSTLELMKLALKPDGLLLVGEPYWNETPPDAAYDAMNIDKGLFVSLAGTLERFESVGMELIEMVLATPESWDRYVSPQWMAVDDFLRDNPNDPDAQSLREWINSTRRSYLKYGRRYFGWGVFVLRAVSPYSVETSIA
ncbi:SAM-dependent methyltransferase [Candidatus Leptofilum sp.]|uniref:SAM-dependent methyltransferase n=1 Tax=Candidatus Leptofilum sp. TaxID=3241576 RepID=UPI003B5A45AD